MITELDKKATQNGFAGLVGVSRQAINQRVAAGQLAAGGTYREWLTVYCGLLGEEAGGRSGSDQVNLTRARTNQAIADTELKQIQIKEKIGALVPVDEIEPKITAMIIAARQELLTMPDQLAMELKALHGVDVDPSLIQNRIYDALSHLARSDASDTASDDDEGAARVGSTA